MLIIINSNFIIMSVLAGSFAIKNNQYLLIVTYFYIFDIHQKCKMKIGCQMNLELANAYYLYLLNKHSLICESAFRNIHVLPNQAR